MDNMARRRRRRYTAFWGSRISKQEAKVLNWLLDGHSTKEMAALAYLSPHTIRDYVDSILRKACVKNRRQLLSLALNYSMREDRPCNCIYTDVDQVDASGCEYHCRSDGEDYDG